MDKLTEIFTSLGDSKSRNDDDFADRCSNRYSVVLLVAFALLVVMGQMVGDPITCWAPVHLTKNHIKYANAYCWVRNTYYLPYEEEIPKEHEHEKRQTIPYYQWIPFILMAQAILFYLPSTIWNGLNQQGGVDADSLLGAAATFNNCEKIEAKEKTLMLIRNQMDRFLLNRRSLRKSQFKHAMMKRECFGRRFGGYMILLYLFTKILYLVNVIAQLYLLNSILAMDYSVYGVEVMHWLSKDYDWTQSPQIAFPRVTMCDFKIRRLGNVHRYTLQCTLPINLYTEKIYMFLWFWMLFIAVVTVVSFLLWATRIFMRQDRMRYIRNHLKMMKKLDDETPQVTKKLQNFVVKYLKQDGVFLLRLIGHNTNTITVSEIIEALWDGYNPKPSKGEDHLLPPALEGAPTTPITPTTDPKFMEVMES